ncbi:MAG: TIGR04282 family arsenosugar biosynthesis glycosyltransferase [Candidatus Rokubacteria bacterium]|nr:TIGR04282 family arsenosugar biosynthesis glycosyltransferase [Candidatus Rokubacteria bacterium]
MLSRLRRDLESMSNSSPGGGGRPPAVAVMAKVPGVTPVKSRLHPALTSQRATELYRCFLLDRLDALAAVPGTAPVVAFTPAEAADAIAAMVPRAFRCLAQRGTDLGERLATLLDTLIADGHRGAIAIDSDSPTLPMAYVAEAARVLESDAADVVVGPCDDGGYYLIGLRAPEPRLFERMPWSTSAVLPLTLERAHDLGLKTHVLPAWFDVDTEADLRRLDAEMRAGGGPPRTLAFVRNLYG